MLLKIRPLAFIVLVATPIILGEGVQHSFYIVYCQTIGSPGTSIGILVAAPSVLGGVGALTSGRLAKIFDPNRLLLISAIGTAVLMGIVPLLGAFLPLLISNSLCGALPERASGRPAWHHQPFRPCRHADRHGGDGRECRPGE
jgi:MFS family permease